MRLFSYWRSSAAYRVRIALNLKSLTADYVPVHLLRGGGEHLRPDYRTINPQGLVPVLEDGPTIIGQSLAIIEYLEEVHPQPPLLPSDPAERARVRGFAHYIASEIHPLNNLRVLRYLKRELNLSDERRDAWYRHWIAEGLAALEAGLGPDHADDFCFGGQPTLADICLVPQMANARRYDCDLGPYPTLRRIDETCRALPAFADAAPERQPDAE